MIAAAIAVAACNGFISHGPTNAPEPRYFQLAFAPVGAGAPEPGQVSDTTATVSAVEVDLRNPPIGHLDGVFIAPMAGRANAVVVGWLGGTCDAQFALDLSPDAGGHPTFTLKLVERPDPCNRAGIPRRLILTFEHVVNAADFGIDVVR